MSPPTHYKRLIIAGSRDITHAESVHKTIDLALARMDWTPSVVLSGTCRGVDVLGEAWAEAHGVPVERYPAAWSEHGRAAGPIRNAQMAEQADAGIIIMRHGSRGSKHMASELRRRKLPYVEVLVRGERALIRPWTVALGRARRLRLMKIVENERGEQ